jgi:hypothetical protein
MRLLIKFANRELDMAPDQLLLLNHGSAEKKVAICGAGAAAVDCGGDFQISKFAAARFSP